MPRRPPSIPFELSPGLAALNPHLTGSGSIARAARKAVKSQRGRDAKHDGDAAEALIQAHHDRCDRIGIAHVRKLPTAMKVLGRISASLFRACFEERSTVDYHGHMAGGRAVYAEAKYTADATLPLSRVKEHQARALDRAHADGCVATLLAVFELDGRWVLFAIPWQVARGYSSIVPADPVFAEYRCAPGEPYLRRFL